MATAKIGIIVKAIMVAEPRTRASSQPWLTTFPGGDYMALKRMSIKVSEELYNYISDEAEREGLSMNAVIIFALNNYKTQNTVGNNVNVMKELLEKLDNEKH